MIGKRFQPGVSGNPGGRPKHSISKIYRDWLKKKRNRAKISEFLDETIQGKSKMAGVLLIREMTERDEGKVIETMDVNVTGRLELASVIEQRRKKRSDKQS
jgi:hypothetical protein